MTVTRSTKPPTRFRFQRAPDSSLSYRHQAVVVAVSSMGKMQMPIHEEIRMIAMRHGFVTAIGAVDT